MHLLSRWVNLQKGRLITLFYALISIVVGGVLCMGMIPAVASAATGFVQFSVAPQYQFGTAGSYLSNGNTITKLFDNDLTTWWDAPAASGGYAGVDLTVPAKVTDLLIAPRTGYTARVYGVQIQGATTSSSTGPWTTLYTVPNFPPLYSQLQYNDIPINTGNAYYRYYRIVSANTFYGSIGEIRFLGVASSTTPYVPVAPVVSPLGGKYASPTKVTITSSTTDAAIYYTIDGTMPAFSGGVPQGTTQLYTGPFLATTTATTTVEAIAVSAGSLVSDVSLPAYFNIGTGFAPTNGWFDNSGHLIEGHNGGVSFLNGKYYWYGENFNASGTETELLGVQAYSSPDLLNWNNEGMVLSTGGTYKIRRPRVIYNATSSLYVMWARNATSGRIVIATSTSPVSLFSVSTTTYNTPSGYGNNDVDLFKDNDGTAYVTFTSNDATKLVIYKLASDYLSVTGSANIPPSTNSNRDAPTMFRRGNMYFLVSSGQNGWVSTNVQYSTTTNPLGTWSTLVNPFQSSGAQDYTTGYNSISSNIIKVNGRTDGYIYTGERYDNSAPTTGSLYNSRFEWLPITFPASGTMSIAWQSPWNLDTAFSTTTLPSAASGISVVKNGSSEVDISWTNNETNAYALYLDRASDAAFTQSLSSQQLYSYTPATAATTAIDTSVSSGNVYYYRIRTTTGAGTSYSSTGIANYSLASDVTPPTVNLISPANNSIIIGKNVLLSASSSDDVGVASVSFYVGTNFVGTSTGTTSPNTFNWDSTTISDGTYALIAVARDGSGNAATSSSNTILVENNVPLLYTSTSTVLQTSTTTITLTGNATNWTPGTPGTPLFTVSGGFGASIVLQAISSATSSLITLAAGTATGTLLISDPLSGATTTVSILADTIAPTATVTAPSSGSTIVGTTTLTVTSSDNVGVATVRFKLDGNTNLGPVGTTSPYSYSWGTVGTLNGAHTISAVATDFVGNVSTSLLVTIIVNNASLSVLTTSSSTSISTFSSIFNGTITNDGGASSTVRGFVYGLTGTYGATTSESGTFGLGAFSTTTTGLNCATTYHYASFATNLTGTAYGSDKVFTTLTCPIASTTGDIQFSTAAPYQFGLTPSYLNQGHVPANVYDGDLTTWWDTTAANGAYVGLDLTVPGQATHIRIAPHAGYTVRVYGAVFQGATTSSTTGPWTNIYTIPSFPPYYAQRQLSDIPVSTGGATYRYYRLLMPNGTNGNLAEFRVIGLPGTTTPYVPVSPTITPGGGRYDLPLKVRLSSLTTDATLYYTTDGSAPAFSGGVAQGTTQLYSGPFVVSNSATTTVRAIAVSQGQFVSEVSPSAQFYIDTNMKPVQDWLDTSSHLIESHAGSVSYFNGKYYWYGQIFNANDPENEAVGISCYSSPDLINWTDEGPIVYLGRAAVVERPHVVYNSSTKKYVMWAHNILTYPNSMAYVAYSDTPTGAFTVATTTLNPDGMGLNDMNLFTDTDGTGYVIYSNGTNTHFVISRLASDFLSTSGTYIMPNNFVNHEAPAMVKRGNVYYLMMSGVSGWAPNQNYYATSSSPLGTWSALVNPFQASAFQDPTTSYGSQTTGLLQVVGRNDAFIYDGDRFDNSNYLAGSLYSSRHIWLPMVFDAAGNMTISWQNTWNLNTAFPTTTPPLAATSLVANSNSSNASLTWSNNATTSYSLFVDRATDIGFTQNTVSDAVTSTTTSYIDTYNYNPATTYYYRIRTLTGAGPSYSVTASTLGTPTTPDTLQAPTLATSSDSGISNTDNITNITTPVIQGTASSSALITVVKNGTVLGTTTSAGNGVWSYTTPALSPDGTYNFTVTQTLLGVTSATSTGLAVVVDTLAPLVTLTTSSSSPVSGAFSLVTTATSSIYGLSLPRFNVTNGSASLFATTSSSTFTTLITPSSTGTTTVSLSPSSYTDAAGNYNTATTTFQISVDLTAPALSSAAINGNTLSAVFSKTLNSALPPTTSFAVLVNGATTTPQSVAIATSTVTLTLSSSVLSIDTVRLTYVPSTNPLQDTLGNQTQAFAGSNVTNTTAAAIIATPSSPNLATSSDSGISNTDNITNITTPVIQGTASSSALITVVKNGTVLGTTTSAGNGVWSYTTPALSPDGTYNFTVTQTLLGVTSATSTGLAITLDTAAPTTAIITPANSATTTTWSTLVSWGGSVGCAYSLDAGGYTSGDCATTTLALAEPSIASHTIVIRGSDTAGNNGYATSTFTYAPLQLAPTVSSVTVTPYNTSALVTWTSGTTSSSQVNYGYTASYTASTTLADTSPKVLSHSVTLSSLTACTQYHYQVLSQGANGLTGSSTDSSFITSGCTANANVSATANQTITAVSGGQSVLNSLTLTVPAGFATSTQVNFQAKKLDPNTFFATVVVPSSLNQVGSDVINLKALSNTGTVLTTFSAPLTVTMSYTPSQVVGLDENSLVIYRYDGASWAALDGCVVDKVGKTVTCQTSHFSDFALFGASLPVTPSPSVPAPVFSYSGSSGGNTSYESMVAQGLISPSFLATLHAATSTSAIAAAKNVVTRYVFLRTLSVGSVGEDVRQLQIFLNTHGFVIAKNGVGSLGHETTLFGLKTKDALLKYQKKVGIKGANGSFGPATRQYINSLKK